MGHKKSFWEVKNNDPVKQDTQNTSVPLYTSVTILGPSGGPSHDGYAHLRSKQCEPSCYTLTPLLHCHFPRLPSVHNKCYSPIIYRCVITCILKMRFSATMYKR